MNDLSKYNKVRRYLNTGDLVEWRTNSLIGWMIRLRTGSHVNHSSLVVKFDFDGCQQRRYILEANAQGIELRLLSKRLERHKGRAYWSPLKAGYNGYRDRVLGWALDKVGTEYDYGSLFKQFLGYVSVDGEKYFCSEFYQAAVEYAEILPHQDHAIQPGQFHQLGFLGFECTIL